MLVARSVGVLAACLAASACGGPGTIVPVQQHAMTATESVRGCPLGVPDARVAVEDTYGGVALSFTSKEHTEDLRDRTRDAAMTYGPGQRQGKGHDGTHGHGGGHGLQVTQLPPVYATWKSIEDGARIQLVPEELADLGILRSKTRAAVTRMSTTCD